MRRRSGQEVLAPQLQVVLDLGAARRRLHRRADLSGAPLGFHEGAPHLQLIYKVIGREDYGDWITRGQTARTTGARAAALSDGAQLPAYGPTGHGDVAPAALARRCLSLRA